MTKVFKVYIIRNFIAFSLKFIHQIGGVEVFSEEVVLSGTSLTLTLVSGKGTKAVRKMVRV